MNDQEVQQLRIDFRELADWYEARGVWTPAETLEFGQAIKAAIDGNRIEELQGWQEQVRHEVAIVREMKADAGRRMRALEASVARARADRGAPARMAA